MKFYQIVSVCGCAFAVWWVFKALNTSYRVSALPQSEFIVADTEHEASQASRALAGQVIFSRECASCHSTKGHGLHYLQGTISRAPFKEWTYLWVRNSDSLIRAGDAYANHIFEVWGRTPMPAFPHLSDAEIDAALDYVDSLKG